MYDFTFKILLAHGCIEQYEESKCGVERLQFVLIFMCVPLLSIFFSIPNVNKNLQFFISFENPQRIELNLFSI